MEQEKQVIFFSDLFFAVLYRWKSVIAAALVLGLLLGGLQLYRSKGGADSQATEASASIAHGKLQIETINANIQSQQEYMSNSILMTMDPYNVSKITTDLFVYTDYQILPGMEYQNPDKTVAVLRAYRMLLHSQEALEAFCAATQLEAAYLPELITTEVVTNSNALSITVRCPDMETAQALTDAVVAYLENAREQVAAQITDHTISVITSPSNSPVDLDLAKLQDEAALRLTNLRLALADSETVLKGLMNDASDSAALSPLVLAVVGAFLGAFLAAAWAVVCHMASDKVYSGRVLENRTGIRILGAVPATGKHRWLKKLEGRATRDNADVVAMNIRNYCGENSQVLCLGQFPEAQKAALAQELKKLGVTPIFEDSPLCSAAALKALSQQQAVVLLLHCGKSRYTQTEKEMQLITDQSKQLLGCVLAGG